MKKLILFFLYLTTISVSRCAQEERPSTPEAIAVAFVQPQNIKKSYRRSKRLGAKRLQESKTSNNQPQKKKLFAHHDHPDYDGWINEIQ